MPKLNEPWFQADFIGEITPTGSYRKIDSIEGAQGLFLYCPCKYGKSEDAHGLIICFKNPRNALQAPENFPDPDKFTRDGKQNPRWSMSGNDLSNLDLTPSVAVGGDKECWHGFITNGEIKKA